MRKIFVMFMSLGLVFTVAACNKEKNTTDTSANTDVTTAANNETTVQEVQESVLNWNIGAEPKTIDPTMNGASDGGDVINQTFEGLVREINGVVLPGIAETWETSDDGLTVTFHLRESNWSDGTPLTAHDFVYSWKHAMDPATASEYSWLWEYTNVVGANDVVYNAGSLDDVGISAVDDLTFEVELINPTPYFVSLTAFYHFLPIKESSVDGNPDLWAKMPSLAVSNGPFVLVDYDLGNGLRLEKNEHYWNADVVKLDAIEAKFVDNDTTAYTAFNAGDFDYIPSVPTSEIPRLVAEDDEFWVFPLFGSYYYNFNLDEDEDGANGDLISADDDEFFNNINLRKALAYSIDREAIVEVLSAGQVPAVAFVPPGFIDHEGNDFFEESGSFGIVTDDSKYAEAVTLFETAATEMGMTVAELQTALDGKELLYNTNDGHKVVAEMVQEMWKTNLGFELSLQNMEWAVFQDTKIAGNFDIARGGWLTDFMDPSGLLCLFTSGNDYNDPNYYNAAYDALISESVTTTDVATHFEKLYAAQEMLMQDLPIIPVYHYTDTMYVKSYVKDWGRSVLGSVDFSRAYIED